MKKAIQMLFFGATACYVLMSTKMDPDNPPVARTGAPGEQTCASSDCHDAPNAALTGAIVISGVPEEVVPGQTYQVTVKNTSTTGKATGFELTCLDGNNAKCGTLATGLNVSIASQNGRDYSRNSKKTQFVAGAASWTFPWTAPKTLTNPAISFYCASVIGNGDGKEHKDNIISVTKSVQLKTVATIDAALDAAIKVFPNPTTDFLNIQIKNNSPIEARLFNIEGRLVKTMILTNENQINVKDLPKGDYIMQFISDNKQTSRKIVLQ